MQQQWEKIWIITLLFAPRISNSVVRRKNCTHRYTVLWRNGDIWKVTKKKKLRQKKKNNAANNNKKDSYFGYQILDAKQDGGVG